MQQTKFAQSLVTEVCPESDTESRAWQRFDNGLWRCSSCTGQQRAHEPSREPMSTKLRLHRVRLCRAMFRRLTWLSKRTENSPLRLSHHQRASISDTPCLRTTTCAPAVSSTARPKAFKPQR